MTALVTTPTFTTVTRDARIATIPQMMHFGDSSSAPWSFEPAFNILRSTGTDYHEPVQQPTPPPDSPPPLPAKVFNLPVSGLGDFTEVWKHLGIPTQPLADAPPSGEINEEKVDTSAESEFAQLIKGVKWRDEHDGADLEDNVEPEQVSASQIRTRKRAWRRARAKERERSLTEALEAEDVSSDTVSDCEAAEELESLRRSPDRRAVIAGLLGRPRPSQNISPPTSPSPPKDHSILRTPSKKEWPVANPFLWTAPLPSPVRKDTVLPIDGFTPLRRKMNLISKLSNQYPDEHKYLQNSGLLEPAFSPLNTSSLGVHVFIDMSNISIGFHDCLKVNRGIPISTRVRRIPLNFHNLSLVLERGRPAAKRVICGSDRTPAIDQAEDCGYETNLLDRVHKAKTPTPKKRHYPRTGGGGYASASGHGETSGSETPGFSNAQTQYKWSEQAVDEILHLKMSHSILDAEKPSTMILATGDAAEAEYSDGFLRMVERALTKGWMVELVSFKLNTSSLYRRRDFRARWGNQFKWIQLDDYAELMIDES